MSKWLTWKQQYQILNATYIVYIVDSKRQKTYSKHLLKITSSDITLNINLVIREIPLKRQTQLSRPSTLGNVSERVSIIRILSLKE